MKKTTILPLTLFLYLTPVTSNIQANFFSSCYDQLFKKWLQETTQQQIPLTDEHTLFVELTIPGTITVEHGWQNQVIAFTIHKKAVSKEALDGVCIKKTTTDNSIKITIGQDVAHDHCCVDVILLVPHTMTLSLNTHKGNIKAQQISGTLTASSNQGNIEIKEASGTIIALTQHGDITIKQPKNNVMATTQKGAISIEHATKSVMATTDIGNIMVSCTTIDSQSSINLRSTSGAIQLDIPSDSNADVYAHSKKGLVTCDHFITTKPQTTQWNNKTWQHMKHEICGIIGSGEARIQATSINSPIKIKTLAPTKTVV